MNKSEVNNFHAPGRRLFFQNVKMREGVHARLITYLTTFTPSIVVGIQKKIFEDDNFTE